MKRRGQSAARRSVAPKTRKSILLSAIDESFEYLLLVTENAFEDCVFFLGVDPGDDSSLLLRPGSIWVLGASERVADFFASVLVPDFEPFAGVCILLEKPAAWAQLSKPFNKLHGHAGFVFSQRRCLVPFPIPFDNPTKHLVSNVQMGDLFSPTQNIEAFRDDARSHTIWRGVRRVGCVCGLDQVLQKSFKRIVEALVIGEFHLRGAPADRNVCHRWTKL
mmetsp:Transcript_32051/g.73664  ORF Transcript_32051/g.73664 Transcript_32051/m.73664 type:complete len:220 (+) Transcript_32051:197-856(+)